MLTDKSYYDYDYEETEESKVVTDWESTIKTDEEVNDILNIFGMGKKKTEEEKLQDFIIKEEEIKHGSRDTGSH